LEIVHSALTPGGLLCLESQSLADDRAVAEYVGPASGRINPGYIPAPACLERWMLDAGLKDARVGNGLEPLKVTSHRDPMGGNRVFATARG
jgi:hypothetical protein